MSNITEYGKQIKIELIDQGKTQKWLIEEIKKKLPDKYIDSSNLYKVLSGTLNSPEIVTAINGILEIQTVAK